VELDHLLQRDVAAEAAAAGRLVAVLDESRPLARSLVVFAPAGS